MNRSELNNSEFNEYFKRYIDQLPESINLKESFSEGMKNTYNFFSNISNDKLEYRYQPEKWTVKEVFQHIIDTERIFMNRCFRIARRDPEDLTSFDQNIYIAPSKANDKSITDLLGEFKINRTNSMYLLNTLNNEDLCFVGKAGGSNLSARAAAFIIPGHDIWHQKVITKLYL